MRSIPEAPFASRMTASFVEQSPSTEIELKLSSTAGRRNSIGSPGRERVVGRDDREHRRQVGVDHPGALRHAADGEAGPGRDGLLRLRVRGHDRRRPRRSRRPRRAPARRREARASSFPIGKRHADDAGREDEHLFRVEGEQPPGLRGRRERVELAALARGRVGHARVDHDRLRLRERQVLAVHEQAGRLHAIPAPHGAADRRRRRAHDREVGLRVPDAGVDTAGDEPLRGRDGLIRGLPAGGARASRRGRARGSRSGRPGRRRPCRGCRAHR